ncbi:MAG TPA: hypothetical protein VN655_09265 [Pseudolabrys sp.]|jgi:hypothetical protein|nr:hypothetical protein [Pseudolabrys sp.]
MTLSNKIVATLVIAIFALIVGAQHESAQARTTTSVIKTSGAKSLCGKEWDGSGCAVCADNGCSVVDCKKNGKCTHTFTTYAKSRANGRPTRQVGHKPISTVTTFHNEPASSHERSSGHRR